MKDFWKGNRLAFEYEMGNKLGIIPGNEIKTFIFKKRRKMLITSFWTKINSPDLRDCKDEIPKSYGKKRAEMTGTSSETIGRITNFTNVEVKRVHNHSTKMHLCWHTSVINLWFCEMRKMTGFVISNMNAVSPWTLWEFFIISSVCSPWFLSPQLSIKYTWNFRLNMVPDKDIKWDIWAEMHYWKGRQSFSWDQQKGLDGLNARRKLSTDIGRHSRENDRFREMMETLIRERCHINCTINVYPHCRSKLWERSLLQRHAWEGWGKINELCWVPRHMRMTKLLIKWKILPRWYILYQVTWKGLNYITQLYNGKLSPP